MNNQHLQHGKIITKKNFPSFVETFNDCVDRINNLKGDGDTGEGYITVDNTDIRHPVIRITKDFDKNMLSGDSQLSDAISTDTSSVVIYGDSEISLFDFKTDKEHELSIKVPNYNAYYFDGKQDFEPTSDDENMDVVVRNKDSSGNVLDYRKLKIVIPPFVHGDGDTNISAAGQTIESKPNSLSPNKSYYQLYKWDIISPNYKYVDVISSYVNLATGLKAYEEEGASQDFLVRDNESGDLIYKRIFLKSNAAGGWDETRICSIEESIDNLNGQIGSCYDDISVLYQTIGELSSHLSDEFWVQGGDSSNCFGSSIGDSDKQGVIDLDAKELEGTWGVDGDFVVTDDLQVFDTAYFNSIASDSEDLQVKCNIDLNKFDIKDVDEFYVDYINANDTSAITILDDINLENKSIYNTAEVHTDHVYANHNEIIGIHNDVDLNNGTINQLESIANPDVGTQIYFPTNTLVGTWQVSNGLMINDGGLTIGNTHISEEQLIQLLGLLNASQNTLNQQY